MAYRSEFDKMTTERDGFYVPNTFANYYSMIITKRKESDTDPFLFVYKIYCFISQCKIIITTFHFSVFPIKITLISVSPQEQTGDPWRGLSHEAAHRF